MDRPESLTVERCWECMPRLVLNPEWERKKDAGELPDGLLGMCGMMMDEWPEARFTKDEADRWAADQLIGDDNQVLACQMITAAQRALAEETGDEAHGRSSA